MNDLKDIRTVNLNNQKWFVGKDIASLLGYKRPVKAILDLVNSKYKKGIGLYDSIGRIQQTPMINEQGLIELISKSQKISEDEKAKLFNKFDLENVVLIRSRGEIEFGRELIDYVNQLGYTVKTQYAVSNYHIDFYIPELKLAIEFDEKHHKYQIQEDLQREQEIKDALNCKFIRVNSSSSIGCQLGKVMKEIQQRKEKIK